MTLPDFPTNPVDVQDLLDEWLASNPEAQKYVSALYFVADGVLPDDATHAASLFSASAPERHLLVAAVVLPPYAGLVDAALALLSTQPTD